MDSVHVDLREKGLSGRRRNIRLCGGNLSETSTPLQIETVKQKNRYNIAILLLHRFYLEGGIAILLLHRFYLEGGRCFIYYMIRGLQIR